MTGRILAYGLSLLWPRCCFHQDKEMRVKEKRNSPPLLHSSLSSHENSTAAEELKVSTLKLFLNCRVFLWSGDLTQQNKKIRGRNVLPGSVQNHLQLYIYSHHCSLNIPHHFPASLLPLLLFRFHPQLNPLCIEQQLLVWNGQTNEFNCPTNLPTSKEVMLLTFTIK